MLWKRQKPRFVFALVSILSAWLAGCGGAPLRARYPSWEPTSPVVPAVRDRQTALADLELSRSFWNEERRERYSYVRARLISEASIAFTFFAVEHGIVTERALLSSSPDAEGLGDRRSGKVGEAPKLLWRERGRDVGVHDDGHAALTIDRLYDYCRDQVLAVHRELVPRLSFDARGLLQHCGFLPEDCAECGSVSIQSVGQNIPRPWQRPQDLLCTDRYGLFISGEPSLGAWECEKCTCAANNGDNPRAGMHAPRVLRRLTPDERERCALGIHGCPEEAPDTTQHICVIDPQACPAMRSPGRARWSCMHLLHADCHGPGFHPEPECTGRSRPRSSPEWSRRCRPVHRAP